VSRHHPHARAVRLDDLGADGTSWYLGVVILSFRGRFTQIWKPSSLRGPTRGISSCRIPLPAVIHWTSPAPMTPEFPMLSRWETLPSSM
jgi:hypothetical protein